MIEWINNNNGFVMAIITLIYVIATIMICVFNGKSAKASREQITASQKQQQQNAGLQLYSMRSNVIHKVVHREFNEVFWDIPILFTSPLFDEFSNVAFDQGALEKLEAAIKAFETDLGIILPQQRAESYIQMIHSARLIRNYDRITELLKVSISGASQPEKGFPSIEEYVENVKRADELNSKIGAANFLLIQKMRNYVKDSIQLKQGE